MTARVLGIGTALPPHHLPQAAAAAHAAARCCATARDARVLETLYRRNGVRGRWSVLSANGHEDSFESFYGPAKGPAAPGPTTGARIDRYVDAAAPLAEQACADGLARAGIAAGAVTHLVTVSCTGFAAPGVDLALVRRLGLPPTVERTHVGFMGCHGALNGLRAAAAFARSDPAAVVLLCAVEVCSVHFACGGRSDGIVANSLFADGAAAVIVAGGNAARTGPRIASGHGASCIVPETEALMTWRIGDHGFEMTLSPRVPARLEATVRPWMEGWLGGHDLRVDDVASWAVHPGGPRVLEHVGRALALDEDILGTSRSVLAECGNMSSPTVLFILERLLADGAPLPCVALGFGPGLAAEAVLFRE
jgi:predicted naringenin-chalcone synthase